MKPQRQIFDQMSGKSSVEDGCCEDETAKMLEVVIQSVKEMVESMLSWQIELERNLGQVQTIYESQVTEFEVRKSQAQSWDTFMAKLTKGGANAILIKDSIDKGDAVVFRFDED